MAKYTSRIDPHIIIKKVVRSSFFEKRNKDKLIHPQSSNKKRGEEINLYIWNYLRKKKKKGTKVKG